MRTDFDRAAASRAPNQLLNDIYDTTLWTFENLSLGGYVVDCAQRERMGYGGDAHATTETGLNNYHLGAFYTKWTQDWRDVQGDPPPGAAATRRRRRTRSKPATCPTRRPTYWGGGGPGWSGFCVTLPWEIYRRYGDRRMLDESFPTMQRWLAFLETKSEDDMLVRWGGKWDFLGDWLWPGAEGVNGDTRETLFFNNCYWIYNLQTAARIADVTRQARTRPSLSRPRRQRYARAVHAEFFDPGTTAMSTASRPIWPSPCSSTCRPATCGRRSGNVSRTRSWSIATATSTPASPAATSSIKTLLDARPPRPAVPMANQADYPGWGDMLRQGATTIWEAWEAENPSPTVPISTSAPGSSRAWPASNPATTPTATAASSSAPPAMAACR